MTLTWSATGYPGWSFDPAYFPGHAHDYVVTQSFVIVTVPVGHGFIPPRRADMDIPAPSSPLLLAAAVTLIRRR